LRSASVRTGVKDGGTRAVMDLPRRIDTFVTGVAAG
jgi:hypothetical protein